MRILIVLDHPYTLASAENVPHRRSFTAAVAAAAIRGAEAAGHDVDLIDLAADHLVFAFPVWWEAMPAATEGFLDRVLTKGALFEELPGAKGNPFGVKNLTWVNYDRVTDKTPEQRNRMLLDTESRFAALADTKLTVTLTKARA